MKMPQKQEVSGGQRIGTEGNISGSNCAFTAILSVFGRIER